MNYDTMSEAEYNGLTEYDYNNLAEGLASSIAPIYRSMGFGFGY